MSVPTNSLNWKEWFAYAEHLASNLTAIGHDPANGVIRYARVRFTEMIGLNITDLQGPCLLAEMPVSEGIDNKSNNLLAQRYLAWTIADRVDSETTDAARLDKELACESLALRVLGRLRADRTHLQKAGTYGVFADVAIDRWEGENITEFLSGNWVGYRIMVPVLVNDKRLTFDPSAWADAVGSALYTDLTGLSCAALNHPTLGLTLAQRLQCILPQYDFTNEDTQLALTVQQVADLTAWLGGGGSSTAIFQLNSTQVGTVTGNGTLNVPVRRSGVAIGSLVDGVWEIPACPTVPPLTLSLNATDEDVIQVISDPTTGLVTVAVINSADEPVGVGTGAGVFVDDVIIYQTDGNPAIEVGRVKAQGTFNLPQVQLFYQDEAVLQAWLPMDANWNGNYIQPADAVPARNILDQNGNVVSSRKVTLADLFEDSIPAVNVPTLCGRISEEASTPDLIATCITSAGKRAGVLAELIPTVDETDTIAQVFDVMTPGQQAEVLSTQCPVPVLCDVIDTALTPEPGDGVYMSLGSVTGFVPQTGTTNGRPSYSVADWAGTGNAASLNWTGTGWYATNTVDDYGCTDDVATPDLVEYWTGPGSLRVSSTPSPAVLLGCLDAGQMDQIHGHVMTSDGITLVDTVNAAGEIALPLTQVPYKDAANADQLTTAVNTEFAGGTLRPAGFIPRITIYESDGVTVQGYTDIGNPFYTVDACPPSAPAFTKFIWQAGDADTYLWTVTADEAGTYGTYTETGTNGTLTYSLNGGGYVALSGTIVLAVGDTITVRRTTTTNAGSVKWEA